MLSIDLLCRHCRQSFLVSRPSRAAGRKYCSRTCYLAAVWAKRAEDDAVGNKYCPRCKTTKHSTQFGPGRRQPDGLSGWCRSCRAESERLRRLRPDNVARFRARYEQDIHFRAIEIVRRISKRARRYNLPFDLDVAWVEERLRGRCELTNLPFDFSPATRSGRSNAFTPSVDRIYPRDGYVRGNCRVVIYALNLALSDLGLDRFLPIAEALIVYQRRRGVA